MMYCKDDELISTTYELSMKLNNVARTGYIVAFYIAMLFTSLYP